MWYETQFLIIQTKIFYDEMKSLNQKPKKKLHFRNIKHLFIFFYW